MKFAAVKKRRKLRELCFQKNQQPGLKRKKKKTKHKKTIV